MSAGSKVKRPRGPRFRQRTPGGNWYVRFTIRGKDRELGTGAKDYDTARSIGYGLWWRSQQELTENGPGVYVVIADDMMKIGRSTRPIRDRIREMQTAHAEPLELLCVLSTDPDDEKAAQARLGAFRVRGEWFRACYSSLRIVEHMVDHGVNP